MRASVRPRTFSAVASVSLGLLCTIVLTGALVRLTGSGLGCSDWPNCNAQRFVDVSSGHAAIEQINRLFTGCVSAAVIAAVLTSYLRSPRRRDLVLLSWGLVVGVVAQVIIGAVVVVTGLNPYANMAHFLVSMFLVACAFMLERSSRIEAVSAVLRPVPADVRALHRLLVASACVAVATGTVVTATGPHAGDEDAVRFGFQLVSVARVHSVSVIVTVGLLAATMLRLRSARDTAARSLRQALGTMAFVAVLQGSIGYLQYFTGVPVLLVGFHIAGATAFWLSVCNVTFAPRPDEVLPAA